jgi:phosphoribosylformylglycinamidine cyclo-ligase
LVGLQSSGIHSNGFSLVRKVFNVSDKNINMYISELGRTLGEELLTPTKIYVKPVLALKDKIQIKAVSHITGGGFFENIPRMLKPHTTAKIELASLPKLPVFSLLQRQGNIPERDMYNTFNMGIGMCMAVPKEQANQAVEELNAMGEHAYAIGSIVSGEEGVTLC